jgi:hypothetical protein
MPPIEPGQVVGVFCHTAPGAFTDERLVWFDAKTGPISGFVWTADFLEHNDKGENYLHGIVRDISPDSLTVWVRGSFFSTAGLAVLARNAKLRILERAE